MSAKQPTVIRLKPNQYIHILNNNTNEVEYAVGPVTFTRQDHQQILFAPRHCVTLPPRHYCKVRDPAVWENGRPQLEPGTNQVKVRLGEEEIRVASEWPEPFPILPGETLVDEASPAKALVVLRRDTALRLRATRAFEDADGTRRQAGDVWHFPGPATYTPRVEVRVDDTVTAHIIKPNQAMELRAIKSFTDRNKVERVIGERWLVRKEGAYLPDVEEEVVGTVKAIVLKEKTAVHLEARYSFTDVYNKPRLAGEQWLVTLDQCKTGSHIPDVCEIVRNAEVHITTLTNRQFCVVLDPVDHSTGTNQLGKKELRKGEMSFFLHPGERLRNNVEEVRVLTVDEALLLRADESFVDADGTKRKAGERWIVRGPCDYITPAEVTVINERSVIALAENQGVYVRDTSTGVVSMRMGPASVMLGVHEQLWEKELPPMVETLIARQNGTFHTQKDRATGNSGRLKHNVVRFNVQHNAAVQIMRHNESRVVHGPQVVVLEPDEVFTVLSLSGGKPKKQHVIKTLQLFKGPDFMSDELIVETKDHARLRVQVSYNWKFETPSTQGLDGVEKKRVENINFSVPDFVGDACKALASEIRAAASQKNFEDFHMTSAKAIRTAVFGTENGKIRDRKVFEANHLVITNVDIKSIEPCDPKTRQSLQQSVQLAIEITTKSKEAEATHKKNLAAQRAKSELELSKLTDAVKSEMSRQELIRKQAQVEKLRLKGKAVAEAEARVAAEKIKAASEHKQAELRAQAHTVSKKAEITQLKAKQAAQIDYARRMNTLEIAKAEKLAEIETLKLKQTMKAIGKDTLLAIAQAGPDLQASLLEGLGLKGYLITDGNSPVNLFQTASGMIGMPAGQDA